jgi:hypothetical protein
MISNEVAENTDVGTNKTIMQIKPNFTNLPTKHDQIQSFLYSLFKVLHTADEKGISGVAILASNSISNSLPLLTLDFINTLIVEGVFNYVLQNRTQLTRIVCLEQQFDNVKIGSANIFEGMSPSRVIEAITPGLGNNMVKTLLKLLDNCKDRNICFQVLECNVPLAETTTLQKISWRPEIRLDHFDVIIQGLPVNAVRAIDYIKQLTC